MLSTEPGSLQWLRAAPMGRLGAVGSPLRAAETFSRERAGLRLPWGSSTRLDVAPTFLQHLEGLGGAEVPGNRLPRASPRKGWPAGQENCFPWLLLADPAPASATEHSPLQPRAPFRSAYTSLRVPFHGPSFQFGYDSCIYGIPYC